MGVIRYKIWRDLWKNKGPVYPVELSGVLYNAGHLSPMMLPDPMFFTTRERFTQLTGETGSSLALATIPHYSDTGAKAAADLLQHELEKQDMAVIASWFPAQKAAQTSVRESLAYI